MADNLLDKASILLTPTAYDDGSMLSDKPKNGDGDFTFSRSSAATRVNAQGLVENVQIISPELVSNGNFSQIGTEEVSNGNFSQEGSELTPAVDFGTSDFEANPSSGSVSESNGTLTFNNSSSFGAQIQLRNRSISDNKIYKITYTLSNFTSGQFRISVGNQTTDNINYNDAGAEGTHTFYVTKTSGFNRNYFYTEDSTLTVSNISVKEVGQNWTIENTWTIGDGVANGNGANGSSQELTQSNVTTVGKTYKVSYDILNYVSGSVVVGSGGLQSGNGTITEYWKAVSSTFKIRGNAFFNGSVTNISVKEVGQDWSLGTGWSIGDGVATHAGTFGQSTQDIVLDTSATYKIELDLVVNAGVLFLDLGSASYVQSYNSSQSVVFYHTPTGSNNKLYLTAQAGFDGSVSNISVKEITDDTDLPRINYEGFSYQDSLGSEEVVNGGFDTDTAWSKGSGWSIADGTATHTGGASYLSQSILEPNKQYKVKIKVTQVSGGGFVQIYMGNSPASVLIQNVGEYEYIFTSQSSVTLGFALRSLGDVTIDNVSVKEVTGQEVVPDSGCGSWLLEPQSTNLITYSEPTSSETSAGGITYESYIWAIGHFTNCIKFGDNSQTRYRYFTGTIANSTEYVISAFVIMDDLSEPVLGTGTTTGDFSLRIGGQSSNTGNLPNVNMGNNIYRVSSVITSSASGGTTGLLKYNSQSNKGFRVVGLQLEQQSYATSYIPTNGATNTRLQDIATNSGNSTLINSTEGVLYAEIAALANDLSARYISLNDGTNQNQIDIHYDVSSNQIKGFCRVLNSLVGIVEFIANDITDFNKIAFKYKENDFALWVNGVEVDTDTSGVVPSENTLNKLNFLKGAGGNFYGKTKAVAVYKEALTDEQLQSLTTI